MAVNSLAVPAAAAYTTVEWREGNVLSARVFHTKRVLRKGGDMKTFDVQTNLHDQVVNITDPIRDAVKALGITDGVVTAFVPHTTCGITVTEGEDPTVTADLLRQMDELVPWSRPYYTHTGGNSAAHIKTALTGTSVQLIVSGGVLQLGMWQGLFLCEFDGPRIRHVWVR